MEKLEEVAIKTIRKIHRFFCDKCGEELGQSLEHADGYCPTPETVHGSGIQWFFEGKWYRLKGHYCERCKETINKDVLAFFKYFGIEKEDETD